MKSIRVAGGVVREKRERAGLSVRELTERMASIGRPISPDTIYNIEGGRSQPRVQTFAAIAEVLGCDREELLEPAA